MTCARTITHIHARVHAQKHTAHLDTDTHDVGADMHRHAPTHTGAATILDYKSE